MGFIIEGSLWAFSASTCLFAKKQKKHISYTTYDHILKLNTGSKREKPQQRYKLRKFLQVCVCVCVVYNANRMSPKALLHEILTVICWLLTLWALLNTVSTLFISTAKSRYAPTHSVRFATAGFHLDLRICRKGH